MGTDWDLELELELEAALARVARRLAAVRTTRGSVAYFFFLGARVDVVCDV